MVLTIFGDSGVNVDAVLPGGVVGDLRPVDLRMMDVVDRDRGALPEPSAAMTIGGVLVLVGRPFN
jgi:hypothetical protein